MESPLSAVDLAEKYDYPALVRAVQLRPVLAQDVDDFGMTPLHWVCSDPLVPLRVLQKLVLVHPAATTTRNLAGFLPLHIALRKNLPLDVLKLLLKFYPKAIAIAMPDGRTPLALADEHVTAANTKVFLQMLDAEVRALDRAAATVAKNKRKHNNNANGSKHEQLREPAIVVATTDAVEVVSNNCNSSNNDSSAMDVVAAKQQQQQQPQQHKNNNNDVVAAAATGNHSTPSTLRLVPAPLSPSVVYCDPIAAFLSSPSMRAGATHALPPPWKLAKRCHICECKFGYFKSRHHCRNCGESVCGRHSRHALPLRHIGLFQPERVCAGCYEHLQQGRAGCNTHESSQSRSFATTSRYSPSNNNNSTVLANDNDNDSVARSSSSAQSLFWSPEAISPRLFPVQQQQQQPPKRSKSVRNYLLAPSPRDYAPLSSTGTASTASIATSDPPVVSRPLFPSAASMFLSHVALAPAPSSLDVKAPPSSPQPQQQQPLLSRPAAWSTACDESSDSSSSSDGEHASPHRRLAKTDLDAPTRAWYDELEDQQQRLLLHALPLKLSMDSRVSELEAHVQQLRMAKQQIHAALAHSEQQIECARTEKREYDAIARKYLAHGYADVSPLASPTTRRADDERAAFGRASFDDVGCDDEPVNDVSPKVTVTEVTPSEPTVTDDVPMCIDDLAPLSPQLSPFRSEQLELLSAPLDVAATHHELGVVLLRKRDFAAAATQFRCALALDARNAVMWYHLATALDGAGDKVAAEHAVDKSLALDGDALPSLSLLGRLLHLRGEHDDAIVVFRRALKLQCPLAAADGTA